MGGRGSSSKAAGASGSSNKYYSDAYQAPVTRVGGISTAGETGNLGMFKIRANKAVVDISNNGQTATASGISYDFTKSMPTTTFSSYDAAVNAGREWLYSLS